MMCGVSTEEYFKNSFKTAIKRVQCELAQTLPSENRLENNSTAVSKPEYQKGQLMFIVSNI